MESSEYGTRLAPRMASMVAGSSHHAVCGLGHDEHGLITAVHVLHDRHGLEQQMAEKDAKKAVKAAETRLEAATIEESLKVRTVPCPVSSYSWTGSS